MTVKSIIRTWLLFSSFLCVADYRGQPISRLELRYTALHEAGHAYVTCRYTHDRVRAVWIHDVYQPIGVDFPEYMGMNEVVYEKHPTIEDRWYDAVSDVAGGEAKALLTDGYPIGEDEDTANMMLQAARLLRNYPLTTPPWPVTNPLPWPLTPLGIRIIATYRAAEILSEHAKEVKAIADALERRLYLSHDDLEAVIGQRCNR